MEPSAALPEKRSAAPVILTVGIVLALLAAGAWLAWKTGGFGLAGNGNSLRDRSRNENEAAAQRWGSYGAAREQAESRRRQLAARWQSAPDAQKPAVLREAAAALSETVGAQLAPFWLGTKWDFNGTTEKPREGAIACGYFVSTLLKHAGYNIERAKLGQQASQNIIFTFTGGAFIHKGHGMKLAEFAAMIKALGPGLHIVGLDTHAGLLWHDGTELWFLHSTVAEAGEAIKERAAESAVLGNSRYRITGNLTADDRAVEAWLTGKVLPVYQPPSRSAASPRSIPANSDF